MPAQGQEPSPPGSPIILSNRKKRCLATSSALAATQLNEELVEGGPAVVAGGRAAAVEPVEVEGGAEQTAVAVRGSTGGQPRQRRRLQEPGPAAARPDPGVQGEEQQPLQGEEQQPLKGEEQQPLQGVMEATAVGEEGTGGGLEGMEDSIKLEEEEAEVTPGGGTEVTGLRKTGRGKGRKSAMSAAERSAKYRVKQIEKNKKVWYEKQANIVRKSRSCHDEAKKDERKKKDRLFNAAKRLAQKVKRKEEVPAKYKTKAALGKATTKAAKALPEDPERAQEVVSVLKRMVDRRVGPEEVVEELESRAMQARQQERNKIVRFYYKPDISLTFPGRKDYVMVKGKDGKRSKMVKHVLALTLREAHCEFVKEEPEIKVSLDCFAKIRPPNVLLRHNMPKNVCVCKYHANINFLIESLHGHEDSFPSNHTELIRATTCRQDTTQAEGCQTGQCEACQQLGTMDHLLQLLGCSLEIAKAWYVKYYRWEEEEDREGKKRIRKGEHYESLHSILFQLHQDWPAFKVHQLVKVHQSATFDTLHDRRDECGLLLQFDFSENAEIQEQDEVQSAHWWHLQVSAVLCILFMIFITPWFVTFCLSKCPVPQSRIWLYQPPSSGQ